MKRLKEERKAQKGSNRICLNISMKSYPPSKPRYTEEMLLFISKPRKEEKVLEREEDSKEVNLKGLNI